MSTQHSKLAEDKWEKSILDYLSILFKDQWIPSHDVTHHRRVWQNAKEFIRSIESKFQKEDEYFFEKLIITSFFHDTGLLRDKSELHGKLSRDICVDFLQQYQDKIRFDTSGMLEVIENHDKKNYLDSSDKSFNALFDILSIADDFDAFGAIGAYRYMEIYLMRNIKLDLIPETILINAAKRHSNFIVVLNKIQVPFPEMNAKYNELNNLFMAGSYIEDPFSLVEWVNESIVKPRKNPTTYLQNTNKEFIINERILTFILKYNEEIYG